jgi:hypothetical protein
VTSLFDEAAESDVADVQRLARLELELATVKADAQAGAQGYGAAERACGLRARAEAVRARRARVAEKAAGQHRQLAAASAEDAADLVTDGAATSFASRASSFVAARTAVELQRHARGMLARPRLVRPITADSRCTSPATSAGDDDAGLAADDAAAVFAPRVSVADTERSAIELQQHARGMPARRCQVVAGPAGKAMSAASVAPVVAGPVPVREQIAAIAAALEEAQQSDGLDDTVLESLSRIADLLAGDGSALELARALGADPALSPRTTVATLDAEVIAATLEQGIVTSVIDVLWRAIGVTTEQVVPSLSAAPEDQPLSRAPRAPPAGAPALPAETLQRHQKLLYAGLALLVNLADVAPDQNALAELGVLELFVATLESHDVALAYYAIVGVQNLMATSACVGELLRAGVEPMLERLFGSSVEPIALAAAGAHRNIRRCARARGCVEKRAAARARPSRRSARHRARFNAAHLAAATAATARL